MDIQQNDLPMHIRAIAQLVTPEAFANYTTGSCNDSVRKLLNELTLDDLFESGVADRQLAQCCHSGLWLLHNFLHESHEISQDIKTPEGSWWHAIMHRLEGDFWNSKYWYRNVGSHSAFEDVSAGFDPASFVDDCENQGGSDSGELHQIACAEWRALFNYCWQNGGK